MLKRHSKASLSITLTALVALPLLLPAPVALASDDVSDIARSGSPESRYYAARAAAQTGNFEWAMQEYAELMLEEPNNVDYMFGYGQALFWSNQPKRAIGFLEQARKLAPHYEDIWKLEFRARIAVTSGFASTSLSHFQQLAAQQFPDAEWYSRTVETAPEKYRWEFEASRENLDNGTPDWEQINLLFGRFLTERRQITLAASRASRFDTTDTQVGAGASIGVGENWTITGQLAVSSAPNFLPDTAVNLAVSRRFEQGWVGGVRWSSRDYEDASVESIGFIAERYFGKYRIAYSLDSARLSSEKAAVHALTANYYADSGSRFGLILAAGEEVETVSLGELLKTDVSTLALIGSHPVNEHLSVGWRLATHRQGRFYRRNAIGLSVSGGF
jgi:YaiO family outer membrane protein